MGSYEDSGCAELASPSGSGEFEKPKGQVVVGVSNLGDAVAHGECLNVGGGRGRFSDPECAKVVGSGEGEFEKTPIEIADTLPEGLKEESVEVVGHGGTLTGVKCPRVGQTVTCALESVLLAYSQVEVVIDVGVEEGARSGELNVVSVSGGGASGVVVSRAIDVAGAGETTPFGVEQFEVTNVQEDGALDTQAGSHQFETTFTTALNQSAGEFNAGLGKPEARPVALPKDLEYRLPPGLVGNPTPFPRCTLAQFFHKPKPTCVQQTVMGVSNTTFDEPGILGLEKSVVPIYNLEPQAGEPARFGFLPVSTSPVFIDTAVRSGENYGIVARVNNITQAAALISNETTFWGVPGSPAHDASRGEDCLENKAGCQPLQEDNPPPFFEMPASCTGEQESTVEGDSWSAPGAFTRPLATMLPALDGCNRLPFRPSIDVTPDGQAASSPTGLTVDVHNPQEASVQGEGLGEADPKDITVTLPEGIAVNPATGDGQEACSESLVGFKGFTEFVAGDKTATFTPRLPGSVTALAAGESEQLEPGVNFCANAAKVATAEILTPLLKNPLKGAVYIATQNENPFGSLIAMYIVVEEPVTGVLVKITGDVQLCEGPGELVAGVLCHAPGQLVSTFENSPQAPFEDAILHFFGGERAPLATPAHCGDYQTNASFLAWSAEAGETPKEASSTFAITSGPNGSACPGASLPFSPSFTGGTININAGAFTALTTTLGREDGEQNLSQLQIHMPAGIEGILTGVKLCPETQANNGSCPPASLIGETTVSAGVGSDPVAVKGGRVFLTETYAGAPFGLSIVNPVKAGPFDLEHDTANPSQQPACDCLVVRAKIEVNPASGQLTITTDPTGPHAIPHTIDGIPVQIKRVNVIVNRPNFTFNPTSCNPQAITGTLTASEGANTPFSTPFQATNCALLQFAPKLTVATHAQASKANGASLTFKIAYPKNALGTQSWLNEAKFNLPKQSPRPPRNNPKSLPRQNLRN